MKQKEKVVIIGGGIAGLTAAHELIERDFDVALYERRPRLGGKAASVRVPNDPKGYPGEHGFHFFPAWYRHVRDTMRRIPVRGRRDWVGEHSVLDYLVPTDRNLLARYDSDPVPILLHSPKTTNQAQALLTFARQLFAMGLPVADVTLFFKRLGAFVRTPEEEREKEYDAQSWWNFLSAGERSEAFRTLTIATTRTLVAAKAEIASAYTIALLAVRTLFDSPLKPDCVLDGPTSETWFDPWRSYLEGRGVEFHCERELDSIQFDGAGPCIQSVAFVSSTDLLRVRQLRAVLSASTPQQANDRLRSFLELQRQPLPSHVTVTDGKGERREQYDPNKLAHIHSLAMAKLRALSPPEPVDAPADYYVFALPVEQMAYYVNRSTTLLSYAPSLRNIVALSASVDWMAGIQYYLKYPLKLSPGHIVCADSEWALTAVEQTQFWKYVSIPDGVQSILSVDISAWDKKGRTLRKEAFLCTKAEIKKEVWEQLKASFNRAGEQDVLRDAAIIDYYIDDDIIERYDRKKQAAFALGRDRALNRVAQTVAGADELLTAAAADPDAPFVFGDRLELNVEPLLINRPGSLALRPTAKTKIRNMFLAGDYVKTATNLACMEGANEAARHAVNAILDAAGSKYDRCRTWRFEDGETLARIAAFLTLAERLPSAGASFEAATGALSTLSSFATQATANLKQFWTKHER